MTTLRQLEEVKTDNEEKSMFYAVKPSFIVADMAKYASLVGGIVLATSDLRMPYAEYQWVGLFALGVAYLGAEIAKRYQSKKKSESELLSDLERKVQ